MPKASEVLEEAIEILQPKGAWCQDTLYEMEGSDGTKPKAHCALGGIQAVTRNFTVESGRRWDGGDYFYIREEARPRKGYKVAEREAKAFVAKAARKQLVKKAKKIWESDEDIQGDYSTWEDYADRVASMPDEDAIVEFNDSREVGSKRSVLALFREALANAVEAGK